MTTTTEQLMAYAATCHQCGSIIVVSIDDEQSRTDNAKTFAECIRRGYHVNRLSVDDAKAAMARVGFGHRDDCTAKQ